MAGVSTYTSIDMITITSCAPEVTNCPAKTYTSSYHVTSTCTEEQAAYTTPAAVYGSSPVHTSSAPVYTSTPAAVYTQPTVITYTSIDHVTITSCAAYVTNCPARTYHSTAYSTSTLTYCPEESSSAVPVPVYTIPVNYTSVAATTPPATYTTTVISTVCPGVNYCYATTVTSTYCPYSTTAVSSKPYVPVPVTTYAVSTVPHVPVYTSTPTKNVTAPGYTAPAVSTNGASGSQVSFGVLALAAVAGLFIAA